MVCKYGMNGKNHNMYYICPECYRVWPEAKYGRRCPCCDYYILGGHVTSLAPGIGMVKRVSGSGEGVMELSS